MKEAPLTKKWLKELHLKLLPLGRKAELARHLSEIYGGTAKGWEQQLQKILTGAKNPRTETYLAIQTWLTDGQEKTARPPTTKKDGRKPAMHRKE